MFESVRAWKAVAAFLLLIAVAGPARAEDDYRLWLRYDPIESPLRERYAAHATEIVVDAQGATAAAAGSELERGLSGLLASQIPVRKRVDRDGALLLALASSPQIRALHLQTRNLGTDGFLIRTTRASGRRATLITAESEKGLLYGTFTLLRR